MRKFLVFLVAILVAARADNALKEVEEFSAGNLIFSSQLYKEIAKSATDNFIASPLSLEIVLALAESGANGQTAQEIITGLSLPNDTAATEAALKVLLSSINQFDNDNLNVSTANKIYVSETLTVKDTFKETAKSVFQAEAENIDFSETSKAASIINSWVEKETNGEIKNLVTPGALDMAKMVLINALYFMGKWSHPFGVDKYNTTVGKFYKSTEDAVDVNMMHVVDYFNYFESDIHQAKFLELPYKEGVTMTIILPNEVQGLSKLEANLEALFAPQSLENTALHVSLPQWETETSLDLNSILQNLGVTSLFTSAADLSGISDEPLYLSKVVQKAFINVTESGTEAGAATAAVLPGAALPPSDPMIFLADHPFLYYIKYNGLILFVGKTAIPTSH